MAGLLPAPVPSPHTTSPHLPQATNPLPLSSSNQNQQPPPPLLLRPSVPSVRWSDPAAFSSDERPLLPPEPAVPILALPALFSASAPVCSSPERVSPPPAISGSAKEPASAPMSRDGHHLPAAPDPSPAMPPESAVPPSPPLPSSPPKCPPLADAPLSAQPAALQLRPQPVRPNAKASPPHLKSYAQAAMGAPGPGFVRAHAHDVDSFARLPRTGINAIRGSREGVPTFAIAQSDLPKVEGLYAKALVMKFHGGRPSLAESHKEISNWGLESKFSIGPLSSRSFLLRFQNERDLLKTLTRPSSTLIKFPYKIFRWHSRCHIKEESCVVPIWISLPRLPLQFFAPELLESIANSIGRFLCLDKATATLARPSEARMCVELDLRKERLQFIWIDLFEGLKQQIVYERVPKFCIGCHVQGHTHVECSKSSLDTPQPQDSGSFPAVQECPQPVRRNAKEISAASSHGNPHQSRASSSPAATDPLLSSDRSQHDLPQPIVAAASSEQQLCDPLPLPPPPLKPAPPDPAQLLPAVQPGLQSTAQLLPATHPPLTPSPSHDEDFPSSSPCLAAAAHPIAQDPCPFTKSIKHRSNQVSSSPSRSLSKLHSHKSAPFKPHHPLRDSSQEIREIRVFSLAREVLPAHIELEFLRGAPSIGLDNPSSSPLPSLDPQQSTLAAAPLPPAPLPAMQSSLDEATQQPLPPSSPLAKAPPSPRTGAAVPHLAPILSPADAVPLIAPDLPTSSGPHPPCGIQPGHTSSSEYAPAAVLSAQASPFSPSIAAPSRLKSPTMNNQHPSSSLRSRSKFRKMGDQGFESEGSFETDSQQYSPSGSPHRDVTQVFFPPQSCVSEGEELSEDHPGFQGHNSDVDFYHRPRSSKKNKRQPDGPLSVQLRARKGASSRK